MSTISLIAAVDENFAIGKHNQLLCHLPADLKHFKILTLGKPIIMGRKTFASIGKPLPGRHNIVVSSKMLMQEDITVVRSLEQALNEARYASEIMIIGGERIFKETLPVADKLYITHIHHQFNADVYFPPIDDNQWQCVEKSFRPHDDKNPFDLTFCTYLRYEWV